MYTPKDIEARLKITNNLDSNFFVEAGAGSGKTTSVVKRMVELVADKKVKRDVSHICAITFTKAAANEFYERFQKALAKRIQVETDKEVREQLIKALNNIDLCFMGTIDAFCKKILEEHPFDARIPSSIQVIDDNDEKIVLIYKNFFKDCVSGTYDEFDSNISIKARNFKALYTTPERSFALLVTTMLNKRQFNVIRKEPSSTNAETLFQFDKKRIVKLVRDCAAHQKKGKGGIVPTGLSDSLYILNKPWSNENLSQIKSQLKAFKSADSISLYKIDPEFDPGDDYVVDALGKKGDVNYRYFDCEELINRINDYIYDIAMDFVMTVVPLLAEYMRRNGKLNFHDNLLYFKEMLQRDVSENKGIVIRQIQNKYKYFFLDEFQDTDPLQAQIFFYLSAETLDVDWKKCIPFKGSLFIVGDPKQSIYRFKGADIKSFKLIKSMMSDGTKGEVIELTENFRSSPLLKDYFNKTFEKVFNNDEEKLYTDIPVNPYPYEIPEGIRVLDEVKKVKLPNSGDKSVKFERVCQLIKDLMSQQDLRIPVKHDDGSYTFEKLQYSDFMVITAATTKLNNFIDYFEQYNIPYHCDGKVTFSRTKTLEFVNDVFHVLAFKTPIYLFNLLHSDAVKVSMKDIRSIDINAPLNQIDVDNIQNEMIKNIITLLQQLSIIDRPSGVFTRILDNSFFRYKINKESLQNLFYALELLKNKEDNGEICNMEDAAKFLDDLVTGENSIKKTLLLNEKIKGVHLANTHQVKGLEAPIVICAYTDPDNRQQADFETDYSTDIPSLKQFSIKDNFSYLCQTTQFGEEASERNIKEQFEEKNRLAYVAATRASNALYVFYKESKDGEYNPNYYCSILLPTIHETLFDFALLPPKAKTKVDVKDIKGEIEKIDLTKIKETSYEVVLPSHTVNHSSFKENDDLVIVQDKDVISATSIGTMVHKLLEQIVLNRGKLMIELAVVKLLQEYVGMNCEVSDAVIELIDVANTFINGGYVQENGVVTDLFNEVMDADDYECEVPFAYNNNGTIYNGVMDLVYYKDSKWHIIDYKTNRDGRNLDEVYKNQLDIYQKAFKEINGEDADVHTYHIDLKRGN